MARLIDRLSSHGSQALNLADLLKYSSAMISAAENIALFIEHEAALGRTLDIEQARHEAAMNIAKVRSIKSTGAKASFFDGAITIAGDDVGLYFASMPEGTKMSSLLSICMPPFEKTFVEFRNVPNSLEFKEFGVMLQASDTPEFLAGQAEPRWLVIATTFGIWENNTPIGPISHHRVYLDSLGVIQRLSLGNEVIVTPDNIPIVLPEAPLTHANRFETTAPAMFSHIGDHEFHDRLNASDSARITGYANELVYAALLAVSFCHCKNVDTVEHVPQEKLSHAFKKRNGKPLTKYYTLNIDPLKRALAREGRSASRGIAHAMHVCRGHFRTYSSERPLFGKVIGTFWVPDHVRGDAVAGEIVKEYRVVHDYELPGRTWEDPDDEVDVAPREYKGANPDLGGRGLRAHQHTVKLLAAHLASLGCNPRLPKPDEPQYDCAWISRAGEFHVAEVKSLTPENETSQVRAAIGQVIDYRHTLRQLLEKPVFAFIALESAPVDERWIQVCQAENITLTWPPFSNIL